MTRLNNELGTIVRKNSKGHLKLYSRKVPPVEIEYVVLSTDELIIRYMTGALKYLTSIIEVG